MRIRKFTFKLIAIALTLSILSIGAVHGNMVCDGSCNCHPEGSPGGMDFSPVTAPSGALHKKTSNNPHHRPKLMDFSKVDFPDMGCHGDTTTESCDMGAVGDRYALQGSVPTVISSGNSSTVDAVLFVSVIHHNHQYFSGLAINSRMIEGKLPAPLYMRHLSLLC